MECIFETPGTLMGQTLFQQCADRSRIFVHVTPRRPSLVREGNGRPIPCGASDGFTQLRFCKT